MHGTTIENLTFEYKARLKASSWQLISRLLPKIHFSKRKRPAHGFFSDLVS